MKDSKIETPNDYEENNELRDGIIGLGKFSARKSYYPELQLKINELKEEKNRYERIFVDALNGIFQAEINGGIIFANPAFINLCGYNSLDELKSIPDIISHLFTDSNEKEQLLNSIHLKNSAEAFETKFRKQDSTIIDVTLNAFIYRSEQTEFIECFVQDITRRKQTEEALWESELRYKTLSDLSQEGIVLHSSGIVMEINKAFCEISGYSAEELIGTNLIDKMIAPDSRKTVMEKITSRDTGIYSAMGRKKNGTLIWLEIESRNIFYKNENLRVANFRDVTKQKTYENNLRESEEHYRNIFENSPSSLMILDDCLNIKTANYEASVLYQYSREELEKLNIADISTTEILRTSASSLFKEIDKNKIVKFESIDIRKDGVKINTLVKITPFLIGGKKHLLKIATDITAQKAAQKALSDREREYSNLLKNLPGMVYRCKNDQDWTMLFVSEGCFGLTGYKPGEIINDEKISFGHIIVPRHKKKVWDEVHKQLIMNDHFEIEYEIKTKDSEIKWVWERGQGVFNAKGNLEFVEGYITDITKRKHAENEIDKYRISLEKKVEQRTAELKNANKQLAAEIIKQKEAEKQVSMALNKEKELSDLKSGFISTVSHEFRNPLASIQSSVDIVQYYGDKLSKAENENQFENITTSVSKLTGLMDELLIVSRAETGKLQFNPREIKFKDLCTKTIDSLSNFKSDNHFLELDYEARDIYQLDEKLIRLILDNLLSNAIKYSPGGGKVKLIVRDQDGLKIKVEDEGTGINETDLKLIFDQFYRTKDTSTIQGTGLGLYIVKKAVERHGGKISVSSREGVGSQFLVELNNQEIEN